MKRYHLIESPVEPAYELECADDYGPHMQELLEETAVFSGSYEECVAAWQVFNAHLTNAQVEEIAA
jgi:hypothetical protein